MRLLTPTIVLTLGISSLQAAVPPAGPTDHEAARNSAAALMKAGNYRGAMLGFMDIIIEDPSDNRARAELRRAAAMAADKQQHAIDAERAALLAGANKDKDRLSTLQSAKARRMRAWKSLLSRVVSMASDPDTVKEGVEAYERLLTGTPIYSDNDEEILRGSARVKAAFYKTIKKEYPYLVEGRTYADERDLASMLLARSSTQDEYGGGVDNGSTQEVLTRADRFRKLERGIELQHANLAKAMDLYERRHWDEAAALLKEVAKFDKGDEEALFYLDLAEDKAADAEKKTAAGKR